MQPAGLLLSVLSLSWDILNASIEISAPFLINPDETVSSLYRDINKIVSASCDKSIVFNGKIILNLANDDRLVTSIGMTNTFNDIQIICKPDCVALLEMVVDVDNIESIPWFMHAVDCLSDPSANGFHGEGLQFDLNGKLIEIDLSHLNLTGDIHLEWMPQSVLSLDLSFNDLTKIGLEELSGKSLLKLNLEENRQWRLNTYGFRPDRDRSDCIAEGLPVEELHISSYQIFPWIKERNCIHNQIKNWFQTQSILNIGILIVDKVRLSSLSSEKQQRMKIKMLRFVEAVTNKESIPWFRYFSEDMIIHDWQWEPFGITYSTIKNRNRGTIVSGPYIFDLSGLGLEGHIALGALPWNVVKLDLSNNNLSSISFMGEGRYGLANLNIENNANLHINLMHLSLSSTLCWRDLCRLVVSGNQLNMQNHEIGKWLAASHLKAIVVDNHVLNRKSWPPLVNPVMGRII